MTQGGLKKSKPAASSKRPTALGPKKGQRSIAPKKASLVKARKMTKKFSAGLINKTERNLAERAGHLELLAGGKKEKAKEKGNDKGAKRK